jgi:hypothetical protein
MIMAAAAMAAVSIGYASYDPPKLDVVAGSTVQWTNESVRNHTVTADDGSYDSGALSNGDAYSHSFGAPGVYGYYCRLHAGIVGEVDVHEAVIDTPSAPGSADRAYPLHGEVAPGTHSLTIEGDDGSSVPATVADDGSWSATVVPKTTTTYRALDSAPVTVLVLDRRVTARARPLGRHRYAVRAAVTPSSPGATVVLQLHLRERFGWWPVASARLGRGSTALLRAVRHSRARARVVLTLPDRATVLAVSRVFTLGSR